MKTSLLFPALVLLLFGLPRTLHAQIKSGKMQLELNAFYSQRAESFTETNPIWGGPLTTKQTVRDFGLRLQVNLPTVANDFSSYYGFFLLLNQTSTKIEIEDFSNTESLVLLGPGLEIYQPNWGLGVAYLLVRYPSSLDIPYGTIGSIRARLGALNKYYGILGLHDYTYGVLLADNTNIEGHLVLGKKLKFDIGAYLGITGVQGETLLHPGLSLGIKHDQVDLKILYRNSTGSNPNQLPYPPLIVSLGVRI